MSPQIVYHLRLVTLIQSRAEGNPFFAQELLLDLEEQAAFTRHHDEHGDEWIAIGSDFAQVARELPDSLQGVILTRIDRQTPEKQLVLKLASIIGRFFSYDPLAYLCQQQETTAIVLLNEIVALEDNAFLMRETIESELTYAFHHIMIREVAYDALLFEQKRVLHERVAMWYERQYHDESSATVSILPLLVHHYEHAQQWAKMWQYTLLAGDSAARVYAHDAVISYYQSGLTLVESGFVTPDVDDLSRLYMGLGRAFELSSQYDLALATYKRMEQTLRDVPACKLEALTAQCLLLSISSPLFDAAEADTLTQTTLSLAHQIGAEEIEAKLLWSLYNLYRLTDRLDEALAVSQQSLAIARRLDLRKQLAFNLNDLAYTQYSLGYLDDALAGLLEAHKLWQALDNLPMLTDCLNCLAIVTHFLGSFEQAIAYADESYRISREIENQ